jgi:hypothetical protein
VCPNEEVSIKKTMFRLVEKLRETRSVGNRKHGEETLNP